MAGTGGAGERRLRASGSLLLIFMAAALVAGGCGSSDDDGHESNTAKLPPSAASSAAEREAPEGASPTLRSIYRGFPKPKADSKIEGAAKVLKAGEAACRGKTPMEVKEQYYGRAAKNLNSQQKKMVEEIPGFAKRSKHEGNFVAGQLAALVYQQSLPQDSAVRFGFQGCVYSLALRLKRELAPTAK